MSFSSACFPFTFSEDRLLEEYKICEGFAFSEHYNKADFAGSWKLIALRSMDGATDTIGAFSPSGEFMNSPLLEKCEYFKEIIAKFECEKESIRLLNLCAGSKIHEHTDLELGYEDGVFRVHVPITTNEDVRFYINKELVTMDVGSCWYGNFNLPHAVENNGTSDRIHLVMDCKRNAWSDALFAKLGYDFEQENQQIAYSEEEKQRIVEELQRQGTEVSQELIENILKS
ncbi:aspartyl/asparaginyl beta-hydroxylase domain-containing protein [uncultured Dokdonia sp.]|uniref:aspartyl/asparaginyl beta-hydroxylase domain-containing protein n=1 Tax=uncultured Dokdonia sp. TaxID=575653 RepID=UPI00260BCE53|nr:aspartyl/asparaginyl beta-hydroxylase domain-containing protein [uncultured Dokdonia sp.]